MNIQYSNLSWVTVHSDQTGYYLTASDTNFNMFQLMNIKRKYLEQLKKDIDEILKVE